MSKPAILFVGGTWHPADYLQPLAQLFRDAGHEVVTIGLPSAGASPPAADFSGDVAAVRNAARALIADGKDVLAVLHSFGGIIGSEALYGLGKTSPTTATAAAAAAATTAGVVAIAYIACQLPRKGNNFEDHLQACGDETWKPARQAFTQDGLLALPLDFAKQMFYSDLGDDIEATKWAKLLRPQSVGVYNSPLTHEVYKEIPGRYLSTKLDQAFSYSYQQETLKIVDFSADKIVTLESGHIPWLTQPNVVKDFILDTAVLH